MLQAGRLGIFFTFSDRNRDFSFGTVSRLALRPNQPHVQLFCWTAWPKHKVDCSPASNVEVQKAQKCTSTIPFNSTAWCLIKPRDNFPCQT